MNEKKIVIIGSGCVGSSTAFALSFLNNIGEIVLLDINSKLVDAEVMDIQSGLGNVSGTKIRAGAYDDCRDCDAIIITAGKSREVGQERGDLWNINCRIMKSIMDNLRPFYRDAFVIVVSNPVDELTQFVADQKFIPKEKLCGTGCMLDTFRWRVSLADYFKVKCSQISAYSVGKHGIGQKLLWNRVKIDGMSIDEYCNRKDIEWNEEMKDKLQKKVTDIGMEIIKGKGKTQYGIAKVVAFLIENLFKNTETIVSIDTNLGSLDNTVFSKLVHIGGGKIKLTEIEGDICTALCV